ncbi:MAG: glycosyltransferase family 4 protein [Nanoarchaeota archaeon]|nr:glycosyltransferase family 4 protein [Nanoarchaeota archaeon]
MDDDEDSNKKEKLRICFVSFSHSSTSTGGIERYLDTTINELTKKGHSVDIVTASYDKDKVQTVGNLTVHNLSFMSPKFRNKGLGGKKLYNYLKKLVKEKNVDIISAENFYRGTPPSYAFAVNLVSLETGVPAVLRMHGHFNKEIEKALVKDLMWSRIMSVSKSINNMAYNAGVNVKKLSVVYLGIDTEVFRPELGKEWLRKRIDISNSDILVMHASRITGSTTSSYLELKGITTLLESFSILAQKQKNVKLLIATAKPPTIWQKEFDQAVKKIQDLAEIHGIGNKIIIKPFDLGEMPLAYNGADIFVMSSQMESFGLVYAEAMACGIPVIGTSVGGIPEIIDDNTNGFLVSPNSAVELEKKIEILVKDPKKRKKMGDLNVEKIRKKFDIRKTTDRLVGIFQSCIEKNGTKKDGRKEKSST